MGITKKWQQEVLSSLKVLGTEVVEAQRESFILLKFPVHNLVVHLVSLANEFDAQQLISLQERYRLEGSRLVHLWEDVWNTRTEQVISRVQSLLGLNKRIHARKTKVALVSQPEAGSFLEVNHIQASARSRYRLALKIDQEVVALACFSNLRWMKKSDGTRYKSAEVIRFANLKGYTVTGGFTKLLKHFAVHYSPDDIMSYADRDWSSGKVYEQAGFELIEVTPPSTIYLHKETLIRYFPHRLPSCNDEQEVSSQDFIKVFNTGNLKYIYNL